MVDGTKKRRKKCDFLIYWNMVRIFIVNIMILLVIASCNVKKKECMTMGMDLRNETLKKEIKRFVKTSGAIIGNPYIIFNDLEADTVEYTFSSFSHPIFFEINPIAFFVELEEYKIPVVIKGSFFNDKFHFSLNKEVIKDFVKSYFPSHYNYYEQHNDYPVPNMYDSRESWVLLFKANKLIDRKVFLN